MTPSIRDNPTDTVEEDSEKRGGNLTPPTIVSTHIVDTHTKKLDSYYQASRQLQPQIEQHKQWNN